MFHPLIRRPPKQGSSRAVQTLRIGAANDALEHEAHRVADQVVGSGQAGPISASVPRISRMCSSCDDDRDLQRSSVTGSGAGAAAPSIVHDVLRSSGQPFDRSTRSFYESRFGRDFGGVRIHNDAQAARSARSVDARAYTVGQHIVFASNTFAPHTDAGRRLIAHELTHVVQQSTGAVRRLQRDNGPGGTQEDPARKAALAPVVAIETQWKTLKKIASGYAEASSWLTKGDTIVALIREHSTRYLDASGDTELVNNYKFLLDGDMVAFQYVVWHAFVYQNLARLRPEIDDLISAFDHDSTHHTGRAEAEAEVRLVKRLLDGLAKDSSTKLADLNTTQVNVRRGTANPIMTTATSASDKRRRPLLEAETSAVIKVQLSVQTILTHTNKFLRNATWEGVKYSAEAVKEFYEVRQRIIDSSGGPDYDDKQNLDGDDSQPATDDKKPADDKQPADDKKPADDKQPKKSKNDGGGSSNDGGGSGKWACYGRSAVLQIPSQLPDHKCPYDGTYVDGPTVRASSEAAACLAAKHAFNAMMPRGCRPKHLDCRCTKAR